MNSFFRYYLQVTSRLHLTDIVSYAILLASNNALNFTIKELFKKLKADACSKEQRPGGASDGCVPCPVRTSQAAPVCRESQHLQLPATSGWAQSPPVLQPHVSALRRCSESGLPCLLTLKSRFRSLDKYSLLKATLATKITFHEILLTVNALIL